jgi:hypothetical protein
MLNKEQQAQFKQSIDEKIKYAQDKIDEYLLHIVKLGPDQSRSVNEYILEIYSLESYISSLSMFGSRFERL